MLFRSYISGQRICASCKDELEKKFHEVKEFIRETPHATLNQIAEENDVTVPIIKQWIREERLEFSPDSPVGLECEKCGKQIRTGRYCDECKKSVATDIESAIRKPQVVVQPQKPRRDKGKMRFLE